jgi:CubicO group peptidase (beta-lactamase class C family)
MTIVSEPVSLALEEATVATAEPVVAEPHDVLVSRRDAALDLLRSVALVRVVLWHAIPWMWLTYFAAMPAMFFVAGSLLSASTARRGYPSVLVQRFRRLLVPLWCYGAAVGIAGTVVVTIAGRPLAVSRGSIHAAGTWILPLVDPKAALWHAGWLSQHLWYIRAYLWILLLAPLLSRLVRHVAVSTVACMAAVAALHFAPRFGWPAIAGGASRVLIGDAVTFGMFVLWGMAYRRRVRPVPRVRLVVVSVAAATGLVLFVATAGVPGGDVNQSYPAIVFAGTALLAAAGAVEDGIRSVAERRWVARTTRRISNRAETVYLWHPAAIAIVLVALERAAPGPFGDAFQYRGAHGSLLIIGTVAITGLAVLTVGWVEDIAARRRLRERKLAFRTLLLGNNWAWTALALCLTVPSLLLPAVDRPGRSSDVGARRPPSYREALADSKFSGKPSPVDPPIVLRSNTPVPTRALDTTLRRWVDKEASDATSVTVSIAIGGKVWSGTASPNKGAATSAEEAFGVASITKTFTAALVLREVAEGRIALDQPMPALPGLPVRRNPPITPRQLLQHTSGLVDYSLAPGFDEHTLYSPVAALNLSLRTKNQTAPGSTVHYVNSNYLWLGLLLEHVTGRQYQALVADLAGELGLASTIVTPGQPGNPGFSSGGVRATVSDLARWMEALFTPGRVLPPDALQLLTTVDDHNLALGAWPLCPCATAANGAKTYTAIGQYIAEGGAYHYPDGLALVARITPHTASSEERIQQLGALLRQTIRLQVGQA